jgi:DNA-binding PadR family transcriptional regulator
MRQVVYEQDASALKALTEPVFLILTSLAERPRHGYALLQDIQRMSKGRVTLSTGTLYGALRRLLEDGCIERFEQDDTSREKQAYRLTPVGRKQSHLELDRMRQLTKAAATRLRFAPACPRGSQGCPQDGIVEAEQRIAIIIGQMVHAIANHNFPKARFYSERERDEREHLRHLRERLNPPDTENMVVL